jgi:hypothetical protein
LAENFNVDRVTVHRRMREISREEIDKALGVITQEDLKPREREFDLFCRILEVKQYIEALLYRKRNTPRYVNKRVRMLYRVCVLLRKKPGALSPQMAADLLVKIRKGEVRSENTILEWE